jgi:hypothetical protein
MLKKRLILNDDNKPKKKTQHVESKAKEPKLAAHDIDWFDFTLTQNKCLKHTLSTNLPSTQEEQLTFLLSKDQASDIKTAFADAIGKVGRAARKVFYPLPLSKSQPSTLVTPILTTTSTSTNMNLVKKVYGGVKIRVKSPRGCFSCIPVTQLMKEMANRV